MAFPETCAHENQPGGGWYDLGGPTILLMLYGTYHMNSRMASYRSMYLSVEAFPQVVHLTSATTGRDHHLPNRVGSARTLRIQHRRGKKRRTKLFIMWKKIQSIYFVFLHDVQNTSQKLFCVQKHLVKSRPVQCQLVNTTQTDRNTSAHSSLCLLKLCPCTANNHTHTHTQHATAIQNKILDLLHLRKKKKQSKWNKSGNTRADRVFPLRVGSWNVVINALMGTAVVGCNQHHDYAHITT